MTKLENVTLNVQMADCMADYKRDPFIHRKFPWSISFWLTSSGRITEPVLKSSQFAIWEAH